MKKVLFLILILWVWVEVSGQSSNNELKLVNRVYALTNATVITQPGSKMEGATVVIRDGFIESVDQNEPPADAQIIKADSLFVYPGFIDGMSKAGLKKSESSSGNSNQQRGQRSTPPTGPLTNKQSGATPEESVMDQLDVKSSSLNNLRKAGFTVAHIVPDGLMIPGTGSILLLSGKSGDEMRLVEQASMYAQFKGANSIFPATIIGVMSKFRDIYKNAELSQSHQQYYQRNPAGMKRPMHDEALTAMFPVVNKEIPVFFQTESVLEAHRAIAMQEELGFDLVLANLQQAWHLIDQIKASNIPVLLSLEMPKEMKEEKKKKEDKEVKENKEKEALKARKMQAIKEYEGQAAQFAGAGIPFGFSGYSAKSSDVKKNLSRMIKAGLSEDQALAALTIDAAELLGVSNILGSLEKGKIANAVVTTGPYFDEDSQIKYVFVDGTKYEYETKSKKAKKAADSDATPAKIDGKWSYIIDVPQRTSEGTMTLKNDDGDITGEISSPTMGNDTRELKNMDLDINILTFDMDFEMGGQSMTLSYDLEFDGDNFSGSVSVGTFGTFDIEGERIDPN